MAQQPKSGLGHLIVDVSRSRTTRHTHIHTLSFSLFWTSDQLVAEAANHTKQKKKSMRWTSMPSADFQPLILAIKWQQTYAIDRAATGIGTILDPGRQIVRCVLCIYGSSAHIGVGLKVSTIPRVLQNGWLVCRVRQDSSLWDIWARNLHDSSYSELFVKKVFDFIATEHWPVSVTEH